MAVVGAPGVFTKITSRRSSLIPWVEVLTTNSARACLRASIVIDCDVLQADGGTRTAAITGAYVALADAITWAKAQGHIKESAKPLNDSVAAVSVGIIDGVPMLDLCYEEDVRAGTDMNVVVAGDGRFIEVQGTAEGEPFDRALLNQLLDLAVAGCATLNQMQKDVLAK